MLEIVCVHTNKGLVWLGVNFTPAAPDSDHGDVVDIQWGRYGFRGEPLSVQDLTDLVGSSDDAYDAVAEAARSHWDRRMVEA